MESNSPGRPRRGGGAVRPVSVMARPRGGAVQRGGTVGGRRRVGPVAGLNPGGGRPAGDDGTADPPLAAVLARYAAGQEAEPSMLIALAGARLLLPLVERPA